MRVRRIAIATCLITSLFVIGLWDMEILAGYSELSIQEMDQTKGTSQMACKFQKSCDEYNNYTFNCAGQPDFTPCSTCENASHQVTYLEMANGLCTGGWKYDNGATKPNICGGVSLAASCQNNVCTTSVFSQLIKCGQPSVIINH